MLGACPRGCDHLLDPLLLDDDDAVRVQHDRVTLPDRRAANLDGLADRARHLLLGPAHADVARPDRQPELLQLLDVTNRGVDEDRSDAARLRLGRDELADERDRLGVGHRQHEYLPRNGLGNRCVHHEVVALAAAHGPRRPGGAGAGHDLDEWQVDDRRSAAGLVDRRGPQLRELAEHLRHSPRTTCGVTRWNASA